ncbi:unnamed protein product [Phytophthora fragariaefolia]|uniref:Unnamed protein product n=1 Tax=Phytophthora fragariaefolia TaxID=1490495 RepID=A0A9W6Y2S4_9STRA|nr:unnamed protein product [Phytophthora fragariaefolia]
MLASNRKFASFPHSCSLPADTMDIAVLLNATDDAEEDWELEASDSEEEGARETEYVDEGDVSDNEALDELQPAVRRTTSAKVCIIAVPLGAVSLGENTVRTKARSSARTYMPSKPDTYGVRFYSVVGWESLYAFAVWDNGSGNRTKTNPVDRYVDLFSALQTAVFRTLKRDDVAIKRKDPSALWVAMCGHLTKMYPAPNQRRLLVCDNFYTRHNLAKNSHHIHMKMLGTIRIALQGKWMAVRLEAAKERMDNAERGAWELHAAVDVPSDWEKLQ